MDYDTPRESLPSHLIAARCGFQAAELLEIGEPTARQTHRISLG